MHQTREGDMLDNTFMHFYNRFIYILYSAQIIGIAIDPGFSNKDKFL